MGVFYDLEKRGENGDWEIVWSYNNEEKAEKARDRHRREEPGVWDYRIRRTVLINWGAVAMFAFIGATLVTLAAVFFSGDFGEWSTAFYFQLAGIGGVLGGIYGYFREERG